MSRPQTECPGDQQPSEPFIGIIKKSSSDPRFRFNACESRSNPMQRQGEVLHLGRKSTFFSISNENFDWKAALWFGCVLKYFFFWKTNICNTAQQFSAPPCLATNLVSKKCHSLNATKDSYWLNADSARPKSHWAEHGFAFSSCLVYFYSCSFE